MSERVCERVEVHSHIAPPEIYGKAGKYGPELVADENGDLAIRVGNWFSTGGSIGKANRDKAASAPPDNTAMRRMHDPVFRIQEMDAANIDVMGVTPSPTYYLYEAEAEIAIPFIRLNNELLARFCDHEPKRLFFMAALPLQDMAASLAEVDRAVKAFGARAVNMGTENIAGRSLDDEYFDPLWKKLCDLDMPAFLHSAPVGQGDPHFDPKEFARRDRFGLSWAAGYIYTATTAVCSLIYGGVLDRFPDLKICVTHGGGFVPFQIGRFNWYVEKSRAVKNKKPFEDYLRNFYFDTIVHDPRARRLLHEVMGPDNLIVGSNWGGWDWVDGFAYAADMAEDPASLRKIWSGNATKLFKLEGFGRVRSTAAATTAASA